LKRFAEDYLLEWKDRDDRKPLIIRGARQTGKTHLVETFARDHFRQFLKVDFEFDPDVKSLFHTRDPDAVVNGLSLYHDQEITEGEALLFFDEIQACPEAIAVLRYFHEKKPGLHVMAAGSLLDFTLRDFGYSMPVGRIEFLYLQPLSFEEFLLEAQPRLLDYIRRFTLREKMDDAIHRKLSEWLRVFFFVGGMPEAAESYLTRKRLINVQRIQNAILTTMENDFAKYGSRTQQDFLRKAMRFVPRNLGDKVKYVRVDRDARSDVLKQAFQQLAMSRVIHLVYQSRANGVPLDAEAVVHSFKSIFLDIGLVNNISGLKLIDINELITVNEGGLAEQFVGQELLNTGYAFEDGRLYYWAREAKNANAEIDYLLTRDSRIVPVEVKAGKTGSLKSLHLFFHQKKTDFGLRFNMDKPSIGRFSAHVRRKEMADQIEYTLLSLPLYLVGQGERLISDALNNWRKNEALGEFRK